MKLQKIASLVLALIMIFSLGITAFAEEEKGTITINGVSEDNIYAVYKLLDVASYDSAANRYSYTVDEHWADFFATDEAKACFAVDASGYVSAVSQDLNNSPALAQFAKDALAFAKEEGIAPEKSSANDGEFVITGDKGVFSDLALGYYLVDSTIGALCGITTTNPNASIVAKNGIPTVLKQVMEDSTEGVYGTYNTADIGQTVHFLTEIHVQAGAQNYVLHDDLGTSFRDIAITEVRLFTEGDALGRVITATETVTDDESTTSTKTNYTVVIDDAAPDTEEQSSFTVTFSPEFCEALEANDKILVKYTAMLNRFAKTGKTTGNINKTWLTFGEAGTNGHVNKSNEATTTTYTFGIDIVKTDELNNKIDGAEFEIYDAETGGNKIGVVPYKTEEDAQGNKYVTIYRRARANEADDAVPIVVKDGQVRVVGLDNGTYYVEETKNPTGYNALTARQRFIISEDDLNAIYNDNIFATGSGVHVVNKTGVILPETGGIGTTIFYVVGGLLVGGAVVALVSKKRMENK